MQLSEVYRVPNKPRAILCVVTEYITILPHTKCVGGSFCVTVIH